MPNRRGAPKSRRMLCGGSLRRLAGGERGTALVEFALVGMVFFLLVFGIIDFSRLFQAWTTVQHAAREGARYGVTGQVQCDPYTDNRTECIKYVAKGATTGLSGVPDNVTVTVNSWEFPSYTVEHAGSAGEPCDALEVQVDYDFEFAAPIISNVLGAVSIPIKGRERMVNEPFGICQE